MRGFDKPLHELLETHAEAALEPRFRLQAAGFKLQERCR